MERHELEKRLLEEGSDDEACDDQTMCGDRMLTPKEMATKFAHEDVYEVLRVIKDPEHPQFNLGELKVIQNRRIRVSYKDDRFKQGVISIQITPTVPHCHLAPQMALCCHERLLRYLPPEVRWKVDLLLTPGTHNDEHEINKRINDKERIAAALEDKDNLKQITKFTDDEICTL
eukprot:TRINITY_DN16918_c0_g1_i1.p1 TRINITY_DN16918_c0_g1~~TRINITY_DN16918_c0_g1_i1.p1  ORF type:complete len:174 (+),score=36.78 TRINITY_DN16918_c0_g1_i1:40-561(+)